MIITYKDSKVRERCTNYKLAKKDYNIKVAEALHSTINFIENAETLMDIKNFPPFNLHPLHRDRVGTFAIDLGGRKTGYRLIIRPLDDEGNEWKKSDVNAIYKATKIMIILEVTNHYE